MEHEFRHAGQVSDTKSVARGALLLVTVLEAGGPLAIAQLAELCGLPKSTVSRTVSALVRFGLLERTSVRGPVRPGPVVRQYASRGGRQHSLAELAREPLERLVAVSGETVNLALPGARGVETLVQIDGNHILNAGQWVGRRVPYHCTAAGKVFLAFGAASAGRLERFTPHTITERSALEAELVHVRAQGWAKTRDELEMGLTAIAAPVRDASGDTVAALTISGPSVRLATARCQEYAPALTLQSDQLAEQLGYRARPQGEAA